MTRSISKARRGAAKATKSTPSDHIADTLSDMFADATPWDSPARRRALASFFRGGHTIPLRAIVERADGRIAVPTLSMLRSGTRVPTLREVIIVANVFGVEPGLVVELCREQSIEAIERVARDVARDAKLV